VGVIVGTFARVLLILASPVLWVGCGPECELASDCEQDLLCSLGECVPRPEPPPPRPRVVPPIWAGKDTGFLWRLEGPAPTYLLGTIHVGVDPAGFPATVFGALDASRTVAIETDIRTPIDQATIDRYSKLPATLSLEDFFPADVWRDLVMRLSPLYTEAELRRLEPWFVALAVPSTGSTASLPTMEPVLIDRATRQGQPLAFMETADEQLAAISMAPRSFWADVIVQAIRDPTAGSEEFDRLVAAYRAADVETILSMGLGDPAAEEAILFMRNRNWIDEIEALHAGGGAFIAVGAAHLLGPGSVLELLRTRGSTVSAVLLEGAPLRLEPERPRFDAAPLPREAMRRPELTWPWL
jgi:hypothetical protein